MHFVYFVKITLLEKKFLLENCSKMTLNWKKFQIFEKKFPRSTFFFAWKLSEKLSKIAIFGQTKNRKLSKINRVLPLAMIDNWWKFWDDRTFVHELLSGNEIQYGRRDGHLVFRTDPKINRFLPTGMLDNWWKVQVIPVRRSWVIIRKPNGGKKILKKP